MKAMVRRNGGGSGDNGEKLVMSGWEQCWRWGRGGKGMGRGWGYGRGEVGGDIVDQDDVTAVVVVGVVVMAVKLVVMRVVMPL